MDKYSLDIFLFFIIYYEIIFILFQENVLDALI